MSKPKKRKIADYIEETAEEVANRTKDSITFLRNPIYYIKQHNPIGLLVVFLYLCACLFMLLENVMDKNIITMLIKLAFFVGGSLLVTKMLSRYNLDTKEQND